VATVIIATDEYSWGTRLDAWLIVATMVFQTSPIFGLGFANYYWYSRYFPIRGYYVPFNSHSQYIDILAQTGVVGSLCFLWVFGEAARLAWSLRNRVPEGFLRAYVYGTLGGIAGTLVAASLADWVLPFTYNIGLGGFRSSFLPWLFIGGLLCIEQLAQPQPSSQLKLTEQGV
jgi:O-antigen ligase